MRRVIGYEGDGPIKRAIYSEPVPAYGHPSRPLGARMEYGSLPVGESEAARNRRLQRRYKAASRSRESEA